MKVDQGERIFKERWELRTGDRSEFARKQSPFVREGCLSVRELPEKLAGILLGGIRAGMQSVPQQDKPQRMIWENVLPLIVCAVLAAFLPVFAWIKVLIILAGAAASVLWGYVLQRRMSPAKTASEPTQERAVEIDEQSIEDALRMSEEMLGAYAEYLRGIEQDAKLGHDASKDRFFGEWIQKFVSYTLRHEDNRSIQLLRDEFVEMLDSMGITVYYELEKNEAGGIILPDEEYYVDERSGEEFIRVKKPIVYSRRQLLARGTIR